jgi:hypothetical protein
MTASTDIRRQRDDLLEDVPKHEAEGALLPLSELTGYEVIGRHGPLGTVVAAEEPNLMIAGGASALLRFHIPGPRVRSIAPTTLTLTVDLDVADFTPRQGADGSIDLYLT